VRITKNNPVETQSVLRCRGFTILQNSCHQDARATRLPLRLRFVNEAQINVNVAVDICLGTANKAKGASTSSLCKVCINRFKKTCKFRPEPLETPRNF
jgi:hypothetical protein